MWVPPIGDREREEGVARPAEANWVGRSVVARLAEANWVGRSVVGPLWGKKKKKTGKESWRCFSRLWTFDLKTHINQKQCKSVNAFKHLGDSRFKYYLIFKRQITWSI
jgi:hypothetical protein